MTPSKTTTANASSSSSFGNANNINHSISTNNHNHNIMNNSTTTSTTTTSTTGNSLLTTIKRKFAPSLKNKSSSPNIQKFSSRTTSSHRVDDDDPVHEQERSAVYGGKTKHKSKSAPNLKSNNHNNNNGNNTNNSSSNGAGASSSSSVIVHSPSSPLPENTTTTPTTTHPFLMMNHGSPITNNNNNNNSSSNSPTPTKRKIPLLSLFTNTTSATLPTATTTKEALETFFDETLQVSQTGRDDGSSTGGLTSPRISIAPRRTKSMDRTWSGGASGGHHTTITTTTNNSSTTSITTALGSTMTPQTSGESATSPYSPRVSFQRLTVGSFMDHENSLMMPQHSEDYLSNDHSHNNINTSHANTVIEDEYSQIMNSEIGREIFFQYIQKSAHLEQIEFLQDTIRLYQDNALLLMTTSNSAGLLPNSARSPVSPRGRRNSNSLYHHDTNFNSTSAVTATTTTQTSFSQPTSSFGYLSSSMTDANTSSSSLSSGGTTDDTNFSQTKSSSVSAIVGNSSPIGGLKKLVKSKTRANSTSSDPNDKTFISTSEILMKYKQQQLQNIQQSLLQQQQQNSPQSTFSQNGTFQQSHIYVGFNLLHIETLIHKYILEHSPKELNLSKRQRQKTLDAFERLKNEKLRFLNTHVYPENAQVSEIPHHLYCDMFVSEDEFIEIFRDLINNINLQLKLECFRDFRKSPEYLEAVVSESSNDVSSVTGILSSQSKYPIDTIATPRRFFNKRRLSENDLSHLKSDSTSFNNHALLLSPRRDSTAGSSTSGHHSWLQREQKSSARSLLRNMKNPLELFMVLHNR
ncbi:hypothetical protein FDP41_004712 [Naegleria fowleri]|uniref:RGS domain-containing protein n=1 Tax=Naegleria fowleri TaxID=5763 RepID=A0A6A5BM96_NAEFO|nr:uncharacterized protein FDP41_004712 [Naegleria fowleri]KAF0976036.1 hypothetical protein FDP41_004712 [Naegleria fowleri]